MRNFSCNRKKSRISHFFSPPALNKLFKPEQIIIIFMGELKLKFKNITIIIWSYKGLKNLKP